MARALIASALACAAVLAGAAAAPSAPHASAADCGRSSVGLVPLQDLGSGAYRGFQGGLHPGGANAPTGRYLAHGRAAARTVVPRAASGAPSASGRIVLLSIGMSNTTQEFRAFMRAAAADRGTSSRVLLVDGAQGGQDAERIKDPAAPFWAQVEDRLTRAGATARQVQAVWLKQAVARETRRSRRTRAGCRRASARSSPSCATGIRT